MTASKAKPDRAALVARCRVPPGGVHLASRDPADRMDLDKETAEDMLRDGAGQLEALHDRLFAQRRASVLLLLQGMDASGKDGAIKRLASGLNPQGLRVKSFAAPSAEERAQGFLWRIQRALPPRGMVGVFNRSHYEDVLAPRVDPSIAARLELPPHLIHPGMWDERLADIAAFEGYLHRQGCSVAKVFLHVSRGEQQKRLLDRMEDPDKAWKFDPADLDARDRWAEYEAAYEAAFAATATDAAPWYVVPADSKPVARALVQAILIDTMEGMDLHMPKPSAERLAEMKKAHKKLEAEPRQ
jgi:PPK2 family polyphosphate:nucleotide phosphotransferase